jgi:hypothetical protein
MSRDSSFGIATGYGADDRVIGFRFPAGLGNFLFTTASRTAQWPIQPPTEWVPDALSLGLKRQFREVTTRLQLVPMSKNAWSYTSIPPIRLHGVVLCWAKGHFNPYISIMLYARIRNHATFMVLFLRSHSWHFMSVVSFISQFRHKVL